MISSLLPGGFSTYFSESVYRFILPKISLELTSTLPQGAIQIKIHQIKPNPIFAHSGKREGGGMLLVPL